MRTSLRVVAFWIVCAPLAVASAETITLTNGDRLNGELVERTDTRIVFLHPQLGRLELRSGQVLALRPSEPVPTAGAGGLPNAPAAEESAEGRSGEQQAPGEEAPEEEQGTSAKGRWSWFDPKSGLFGTPILRGWDNRLGLGLSGSQGGFEDTKLNVIFRTGTRDERRAWIFDGSYFLNVTPPQTDDQDQRVSKNQALVLLRRDWLRTPLEGWPRLFAFAQGRYQYDQFQPWLHRPAGHAGPGYRLVDNERWRLPVRLGLGVSHAFGQTDRTQFEGMLGFDVELRLNHWNTVTWRNEFVLDLLDARNFRNIESLDWYVDLSEGAGLGFKIGLLYKYDTESVGKVNDLTYLGSLTYDF